MRAMLTLSGLDARLQVRNLFMDNVCVCVCFGVGGHHSNEDVCRAVG